MAKGFQNIWNSQWKNTFLMAASSGIGQIISFLLLPILGRIFSPEEFNEFSLIYAWIIPLSILSTLKIELAIPQCTDLQEKYRVTRMALFSTILQTLLLFIPITLWNLVFDGAIQWYYLPVGVLSFSVPQILNILVTSVNEYTKSSWYRIINNLSLQLFSALFGYIGWGGQGLILGFIIGQLMGAIILMKGHFNKLFNQDFLSIQIHDFKRFSSYIRYSMPQGIIETLQLSGTITLLSYLFGNPVPGIYYLTWRILQAPITMISNSVFVVQYNRCMSLKNAGASYSNQLKKNFLILLVPGLFMGVFLMLAGPMIFDWFLGSQHRPSGEMAKFLAPWFIFQFCVSPFSFVALIENEQKKSLLLNLIDFLLKTIGLVIGYYLNQLETGLILYSAFSCILLIYSYFWYYRLSKSSFSKVSSDLFLTTK
jgi:O-antigen/teichoic acid export membrane protein